MSGRQDGAREAVLPGVLAGCGIDPLPEASPAVRVLTGAGLPVPSADLRRALAVSLMHRSYLYEQRGVLPDLTVGVLVALESLGKAFISREVATTGYPRFAAEPVGKLSSAAFHAMESLAGWAGRQEWIRQSCLLGGSLADEATLPPKVPAGLLHQAVGLLYVAGHATVARRLLADFTLRALSSTEPVWRTMLEKELRGESLRYEVTSVGPDNARTFTAAAVDGRGRHAEGQGRSIKAAKGAAAENFLRRFYPLAVKAAYATAPAPAVRPSADLPDDYRHQQAVARVQRLFSLPDRERSLICQALLHSSWTYENRRWVTRARQHSNATLAFLGSQVLIFENTRAQALTALQAPPDDLTITTLPNSRVAAAFELAELDGGLLMGAGQANLGLTMEIAATALQAVVGAVYAARGYPDTLEPVWPAAWEESWRTLTADTSVLDPASLLQYTCSALSLDLDFEDDVTGPDHDRRYMSTVVLTSTLLGATTRIRAREPGTSRTKGRRQAAVRAMRVLDALAEPLPARALSTLQAPDRALGTFLLQQMAGILQGGSVSARRWYTRRLFALHMAGDPEALISWAVEADQILASNPDHEVDSGLLAAAVWRVGVASGSPPQRTHGEELAEVRGAIHQLEDPAAITSTLRDRLTQLCALYRAHGGGEDPIAWADLIGDWELLHRGRLTIDPSCHGFDFTLTGRERTVLDAAVTEVQHRSGAPVTVSLARSQPLQVRVSADEPNTAMEPSAWDDFCTLWSQVTPTTRLQATTGGLLCTVTYPDLPADPGPITAATLILLRPPAQPLAQSIADLLHDIKNQISAANQALALPASSRTGQLENQAAASAHLDQAQAYAQRLLTAGAMPDDQMPQALDLGSFLHTYTLGVFRNLPRAVSLSTPQAIGEVQVDISAAALRAVLDNLVKNALEAMNNAGTLTITWTATPQEAVIQVADNGPGLPQHVLEAFSSGTRINSGKPGGNGLGLLGARALLSNRGGQLTPAGSATGTTWHITLPLATPDQTETQ